VYAFPRLLHDRLGEAASGPITLELEELQMHPLFGPSDLVQSLLEGLRAIAEQGKPVAGTQGCVAGTP
jgi:hypothetical protein